MKYVTFILSLVCSFMFSTCLVAQWQQLNMPTGVALQHVTLKGDTLIPSFTGNMLPIVFSGREAADGHLWYSTSYGLDWDTIHNKPFQGGYFHFNSKSKILYALGRDSSNNDFAYQSKDGGATWQKKGSVGNLRHIQRILFVEDTIYLISNYRPYRLDTALFVLPEQHPLYYFNDIGYANGQLLATTPDGIVQSSDRGETWKFLFQDQRWSSVHSFNHVIYICKEVNYVSTDTTFGLYRSEDGGITRKQVMQYSNDKIFRMLQNTNGRLYALRSSGTYYSDDNGFTWNLLPYVINDLMWASGDTLIGQLRYSFDEGAHWETMTTARELNRTMPTRFLSASEQTLLIPGYYSNNNGRTFQDSYITKQATRMQAYGNLAFAVNGETSLKPDNLQSLMISEDAGRNWRSLEGIVDTGEYCTDFAYHPIWNDLYLTIQNHKRDTARIYRYNLEERVKQEVFKLRFSPPYIVVADSAVMLVKNSDRKEVDLTRDRGNTWQNPLLSFPASVDISNAFGAGKYIAFYYNFYGLLISDNYGRSWQSIGRLPNINSFISHGDILFSGSTSEQRVGDLFDGQVWNIRFALDGGKTWIPFREGLSDKLQVLSTVIKGEYIYAIIDQNINGVLQRGLWRRPLTDVIDQGINGFIFKDDNNNGIQEATESNLANVLVSTHTASEWGSTNESGKYFLYGKLTNDTIQALPPIQYATTNPPFAIIDESNTTYNFGIHFLPNQSDLQVDMAPLTPIRPGFDAQYKLTCKNAGSTLLHGTISLKYDKNNLTYKFADPLPLSIADDSITWKFDSLQVLQTHAISTVFTAAVTNRIGDSVVHLLRGTVSNELTPTDNLYRLSQEIVGSFDPNDKQVFPNHSLHPDQIKAGEKLEYTIRFQNTGNYKAERVRIVDTLNIHLDIKTLQVVAASHPYTWKIKEKGIVEFIFDTIDLPDSSSNEAASHGFIKFSLQPKKSLRIGDEIFNRGAIYFDFNDPIITNTVTNQVRIISNVNTLKNTTALDIFPNPASDAIRVRFDIKENQWIALELCDMNGKQLLAIAQKMFFAGTHDVSFSVAELPKGIYILKLRQIKGIALAKLIVQ